MSNGEMLEELQLLLRQEKITAKAAQRMTLSAVAEVLKDTGALTERIDVVADQITGLQNANEKILVVIGRHNGIIDSWSTNSGSRFVVWCGKHIKFMLIALTTTVIVVAVDIIKGGHWSDILANIDSWLKYLKLVL